MQRSFSTDLKIGVLGGGQLGRMLIQKAIDFGLELFVMDQPGSPCSRYAAHFTAGDIQNETDVLNFGSSLDILTIEIENVNVAALYQLERQGVRVFPQPKVIELIQDKGLQKEFYEKNNLPTADYLLIHQKEELKQQLDFLPAMQKMRKGGYDGKGVQRLKDENDLSKAFSAPSVLEKLVDLKKELSVIVSRNEKGEMACFPLVEQEFNPEANLVEFLFSPADVDQQTQELAQHYATRIIEQLDMVGLLAVEFFLDQKGNLLVNEIAPRPHNSGHQTIEGNYTSQFEQHLRAISGLPLGSTALICPSVMVNLLGSKGSEGPAHYEGIEEIMTWEGVYPHIYGKTISKPYRKMGHITVIQPELETAKKIALKVKETIRVIGKS
ncbi:MAG: 5-(carboxyamino)imidazole ribonucleotide synthase [Crocinitomicaceae bacterium]